MTELRAILYPFGFLAYIAFGARFLLQWIQSERERKSVTPALFWKLSITGNLLLFIHSLIQIHYPMCLCQGINGVLAWRNMNLESKSPRSIEFVYASLFLITTLTTLFFAYQGVWILSIDHTGLHILGSIGILCHSVRFWVQWWQAESQKTNSLTQAFWWLSFIGALLCSIYFFLIRDWVNLVAPLLSLVPFGRNLWLIYQQKEVA